MKLTKTKTFLILFCLFLPFLLLLFSYQLTIAIYPLVPDPLLTSLTPHQQNTLDFLQGRIEAAALTVSYNSQELAHLYDVQQVMQWAEVMFILLLLATLALLYHSKAEWKKFVRWGGITTVAIVSLIILTLLLSFNTVFTLFHLLFFPQGNWLFPAESLLIQTFPLAFFVRMGMMIFGGALGMGILMLLLPKIMGKFYKGEEKLNGLEMNKEVKEWWERAKSDLDTARYLYKGNKFEEAAFFCQQALEKGFKAILLHEGKQVPKIHDLVTLGEKVELPVEFEEISQELSVIYISTRYPGIANLKDIQNKAARYLNLTEKVLPWIKEKLS